MRKNDLLIINKNKELKSENYDFNPIFISTFFLECLRFTRTFTIKNNNKHKTIEDKITVDKSENKYIHCLVISFTDDEFEYMK